MSDWEVDIGDEQHASTPTQSDWGIVPFEDNQESAWKRVPRDVLIGLTHAGRNLHNLPHDLSKFAEWPVEKIAGPLKHPLSSYLPYDESDYSKVLGQKNQLHGLDKFIQKGVEYAPDIIGGANALRSLKLLPHLTRRGASRTLNKAHKLGISRNMNALEVNPESIEDLRQFLPNTTPYRNLLNKAHSSIGNIEKNKAKIPFEKYDIGPSHDSMFGVAHNSGNTVLPTNYVRMKGTGNKARVISSNVEPSMRGKGIGKEMYKEAIDDAIKKGLQFESDSIVSHDALNVYKALEKEGYKFKFNPNVKEHLVEHNGNHYKGLASFDEESPIVELISKPKPKAKPNNYQTLFDLQSDAGKHAADYNRSLFSAAERAHGRAGLTARNALLEDIHKALQSQGHHDISALLKKGQDEYRRYMKFKPYRNALMATGAAYMLPKNVLIDLAKKLATMSKD